MIERYFVKYVDGYPKYTASSDPTTSEEAIQELLDSGYVEVDKEEWDRIMDIKYPQNPDPDPVPVPTVEELAEKMGNIETDIVMVKSSIAELTMMVFEEGVE